MTEIVAVLKEYGPLGLLLLAFLLAYGYYVRKWIDSKFERERQTLGGIVKQAEVQFGNLHDARFKTVPILQRMLKDANDSARSIRTRNSELGANGMIFDFSFTSHEWYQLRGELERNIFLFKKDQIQPLVDAVNDVIFSMEEYTYGLKEGFTEASMAKLEVDIQSKVQRVYEPARAQAEDLFRELVGVTPPSRL
jgi:hypothetical protein